MPSSNAYYNAELAAFLRASTQEIIGALASNSQFSVEPAQRDAWLLQITILQSAFVGLDGTVFLEFVVPRIGSRLDVVLISGPAIFAIEFKVGESDYRRVDINQVWDYALDLKNFHKGSHDAPIIPMLVATEAPSSDMALPIPHADGSIRLPVATRKAWHTSSRKASPARPGVRSMRSPGTSHPINPLPPSSKPHKRSTLSTPSRPSPATMRALAI